MSVVRSGTLRDKQGQLVFNGLNTNQRFRRIIRKYVFYASDVRQSRFWAIFEIPKRAILSGTGESGHRFIPVIQQRHVDGDVYIEVTQREEWIGTSNTRGTAVVSANKRVSFCQALAELFYEVAIVQGFQVFEPTGIIFLFPMPYVSEAESIGRFGRIKVTRAPRELLYEGTMVSFFGAIENIVSAHASLQVRKRFEGSYDDMDDGRLSRIRKELQQRLNQNGDGPMPADYWPPKYDLYAYDPENDIAPDRVILRMVDMEMVQVAARELDRQYDVMRDDLRHRLSDVHGIDSEMYNQTERRHDELMENRGAVPYAGYHHMADFDLRQELVNQYCLIVNQIQHGITEIENDMAGLPAAVENEIAAPIGGDGQEPAGEPDGGAGGLAAGGIDGAAGGLAAGGIDGDAGGLAGAAGGLAAGGIDGAAGDWPQRE